MSDENRQRQEDEACQGDECGMPDVMFDSIRESMRLAEI